ncbi:MAG TPA: L-rhamnose mutarotase [Rectinemataceae bacterium]|nr:L-rhamnose mutarotase [Rectinemataceae bacterium]
MQRVAFTMKLKPGFEEEYRRRHDEIWPELSALLRDAGISDYSIFLDPESLVLFAVQKLAPGNKASTLSSTALMRRWWEYMKDLMDTNPDSSPVCKDLVEVFHLD